MTATLIHLHSCADVQFGVEDLTTYIHLMNVALNLKLCQGRITEAVEIGEQPVQCASYNNHNNTRLLTLIIIFIGIVVLCINVIHPGSVANRLNSRMHDVSTQTISLPLLLYAQMASFK